MTETALIIDDDTALCDGLRRALRQEPYRVFTAVSAEQALSIIAGERIDVVVTDDHMPGLRGVDFLRDLHERKPEIVSLMMSGDASVSTIVRALNDGHLFRFLIKPFAAPDLARFIRQALTHKLLLDRARELLLLSRRQADALSALERKQPGIVRSAQSTNTNIVVKPDDFHTLDQLTQEMDVQIHHGHELFDD